MISLRRAPGPPVLRAADHLRAAGTMAVVPSLLAYVTATASGGCHYKRVIGVYEWWCLFPVTVIATSLGFLLPVPAAIVAPRAGAWIARTGWIAATLAGGLLAQVAIVGYVRLVLVGDGVNPMTTAEMLLMPWPFMAGAISAGVYRGALVWRLARSAG